MLQETIQKLKESAVKELDQLVLSIANAETAWRHIEMCKKVGEYPEVPFAMGKVSKSATLPNEAGVYFAWNANRVVYVGQSINLGQRVRCGHHCLDEGQDVSWLLFHVDELNFAESFYIGVCRPSRNFGNRKRLVEAADFTDQLRKEVELKVW